MLSYFIKRLGSCLIVLKKYLQGPIHFLTVGSVSSNWSGQNKVTYHKKRNVPVSTYIFKVMTKSFRAFRAMDMFVNIVVLINKLECHVVQNVF